jgi:hypothetical protein
MSKPQFDARSALASMEGWNLGLHCPSCGLSEKPARELFGRFRISVSLGWLLPRLRCPKCSARPEKLEAVCVWIIPYGRKPLREDLTVICTDSAEELRDAA